MALLHNGVTVLDFDHTYESQAFLHYYEWLKMDDIPSTSKYCDNASLVSIHKRLQRRSNKGVTFIGSGNYHYVSLLLLAEVQTPFSLVLFDHHTDLLRPTFLPFVSCGSWVLHALEQFPLLEKVIIIGTNADFLTQLPPHFYHKISVICNNHYLFGKTGSLLQLVEREIPTQDIYISIDKDVLDEVYAKTNWDHGTMSLHTLNQLLHLLLQRKRVLGIDICGELPFSFPGEENEARKNEQANAILLETIRLHSFHDRKKINLARNNYHQQKTESLSVKI
ncbi:MAG: arginase family protein [Bacillus sp. (in: Bacteria)]|nr:arginase family protein [Bacillus sp. (in: firmicutes)]